MEKKKTATKTSSRAKLNVSSKAKVIGAIAAAGAIKAVENSKSDVKKGKSTFIVVAVMFVVGILLGAFVIYNVLSKNDCFEIIGNDELSYTLDEKYVEQGVKIIEFNKDISDQVIIESNLNLIDGYSQEVGTFYVKYTVNSVKYGKIFKIEKIRLITFEEVSEGGE